MRKKRNTDVLNGMKSAIRLTHSLQTTVSHQLFQYEERQQTNTNCGKIIKLREEEVVDINSLPGDKKHTTSTRREMAAHSGYSACFPTMVKLEPVGVTFKKWPYLQP